MAAAVASAWQLFPSGDRQGQLVARHQPATLAAMEGLFATRTARIAGADRTAQHGGGTDRQHAGSPWRLERADPQAVECLGDRPRPDSARRPTRQHRAPLLQLPRDGRARDAVHLHHGPRARVALAGPPRKQPPAALDLGPRRAIPLRRKHGRMDDRRARPATVARLWAHADLGRNVCARVGRDRAVFTAGVHGPLRSALRSRLS